MLDALFIIFGLILFEIVTSLDNAVINANVLSTLSQKMRRWFLTWGIFFSVFLVRGLLPLAMVMISHPGIGIQEALSFSFEEKAFQDSTNVLLISGGVFLVCTFLHWLFMEPKVFGLHAERFFFKLNVWFYAVISIFLVILVWFAIQANSMMAFGAVVGSTIFFIVHGFRLNAEKIEHEMVHKKDMSDWSKVLYLEAIDASFSIDGIVGAFAFTLWVPLIIIGNGIGAIAVRQLTIANIDRINKYKYLKHGAMYSIFMLGLFMIADSFGFHHDAWTVPLITVVILGYFFMKSKKEISNAKVDKTENLKVDKTENVKVDKI